MNEVFANRAIVIDNGSGVLKAGFAGDEQPKCMLPSLIGKTKYRRVMAGGIEGDNFVGNRAQELRGLLKLRYPIEHGVVLDWDSMEHLWNHLYSEELKISPETQAVLLTEPPLNPVKHREKAAQLLFEVFNVPALCVCIQAVPSLYASGRTTGIVLDSGDGTTHAVPVYEGFAVMQGIRRMDLAGRDVTDYFQTLLRRAGYVFKSSAEYDLVRGVKEKTCFVAPQSLKESKSSDYPLERYLLPDGNPIYLGAERYSAPEILFDPGLIGDESSGIPNLLFESIMKCDVDFRKTLYSTIVLSGGSTLFRGFGDRLLHDMRKLAPKDTKIRIYAPPERKNSTWIGGSILASLSTFKKMWVTSEEYQEDPDIINRKFF